MPGCGNRSGNITKAHANIKAQSPFDQTLHVFFPASFPESHKTCFRLLNTQGQTVWIKQMNEGTNEVELLTGSIIPGFYILQIENEEVIHSLKVIKS
ncbi:MAG: T9SS type A sorting domain-containing protein [Saprospiraceae bacterium]